MVSRWKSQAAVVVVATSLGFGLASCGSDSKGSASKAGAPFPVGAETSFKTSCIASAKASAGGKLTATQIQDYCGFTLSCLERRLTLKRFEQYVANVQAGKVNPDANVVSACVAEAGAKVRKG